MKKSSATRNRNRSLPAARTDHKTPLPIHGSPLLRAEVRKTVVLALAVIIAETAGIYTFGWNSVVRSILLTLPLAGTHFARDARSIPASSTLVDGSHLPGMLILLAYIIVLPHALPVWLAFFLYPLAMLVRAPHKIPAAPVVRFSCAALIPAIILSILLRLRHGSHDFLRHILPQSLTAMPHFAGALAGLVALLLLFLFRDFYCRGAQPSILLARVTPRRRKMCGALLDAPAMLSALGVFLQAGLFFPQGAIPASFNIPQKLLYIHLGAILMTIAVFMGPVYIVITALILTLLSLIHHFKGNRHAATERRLVFIRRNMPAE